MPYAASRSVKEGKVDSTSRIVGSFYAGFFVGVDPSLRAKFRYIWSPEIFVPVDSPWRKYDLDAGGYKVSKQNGRSYGVSVDNVDGPRR
jgi:hypothetical protein